MPNHVKNKVVVTGSQKEIDRFLEEISSETSQFDFNRIIPMPQTLYIQSGSRADDCLLLTLVFQFSNPVNPINTDIPIEILQELDPYGFKQLLNQQEFIRRVDSCKKWLNDLPDQEKKEEPKYLFDGSSSPKTKQDAFYLGKTMLNNIQQYGAKDWYDWHCINWGTKWSAYEISIERPSVDRAELEFQTAWSMPEKIFIEIVKRYLSLHFDGAYADEDIGHNCGKWAGVQGNYYEIEPLNFKNAVHFSCEVWGVSPEEFSMD